jgi:acyl carrier protein
MTRAEIQATMLQVLGKIAPEADLGALPETAVLRDELEIDSMDFLNFAIGLHQALGVDIPESDYERMASLRACVDYLASRLGVR